MPSKRKPARRSTRTAAAPLPPFDPQLRYPVERAAEYLSVSRAHIFTRIKNGDIATIRDGRRVYVPGSEIARLSSLS